MAAERVLYWGSGSSPAWRVQACLDEKKLKYESKQIEFSKRGHKGPEIVALNPRGQVPTFKDGEVVVNESLAALLYLEKNYPEPALLPSDKKGSGLALQRTEESNNLMSSFRDVAIAQMRGMVKTEDEKKAWLGKVDQTKTELGYWEGYLGEGEYIAGDSFSLADLAVAPLLLAYQRFGASFDAYPKLKAYTKKLSERPSIADNSPPHWKESPPQTYLNNHL